MNIIETGMLVYLRLLLVLEFLKINGKFHWGQECPASLWGPPSHLFNGYWVITWIDEAGMCC